MARPRKNAGTDEDNPNAATGVSVTGKPPKLKRVRRKGEPRESSTPSQRSSAYRGVTR